MTIKTANHYLQCKLIPTPARWKLVRPDGTVKISKFFLSLLREVRTKLETAEVRALLEELFSLHKFEQVELLFKGEVPSLACMVIDDSAVLEIELFPDGKLTTRSLNVADNPLNPRHQLADALNLIDALADMGPDEKLFLRTLGRLAGQFSREGDLSCFNDVGPHFDEVQAYLASQ